MKLLEERVYWRTRNGKKNVYIPRLLYSPHQGYQILQTTGFIDSDDLKESVYCSAFEKGEAESNLQKVYRWADNNGYYRPTDKEIDNAKRGIYNWPKTLPPEIVAIEKHRPKLDSMSMGFATPQEMQDWSSEILTELNKVK